MSILAAKTGAGTSIWSAVNIGVAQILRLVGFRGRAVVLSITIYGIKNCETMNKARAWLDKHGVGYAFHDYKIAGIDRERLERGNKKVGWETLLNRAGMTFRKLPDKDKKVADAKKA